MASPPGISCGLSLFRANHDTGAQTSLHRSSIDLADSMPKLANKLPQDACSYKIGRVFCTACGDQIAVRRTACSGVLSSAREKDCDRNPAATLRGRRTEFVGINNCYINESGVIKPARDVGTVESEPPIVLFCPQPLMGVRIGIGDN